MAVDAAGDKLSKQTRALPVDGGDDAATLVAALRFLGQEPPPGLAAVDEIWGWAQANWRLDRVPGVRTMPVPALPANA